RFSCGRSDFEAELALFTLTRKGEGLREWLGAPAGREFKAQGSRCVRHIRAHGYLDGLRRGRGEHLNAALQIHRNRRNDGQRTDAFYFSALCEMVLDGADDFDG